MVEDNILRRRPASAKSGRKDDQDLSKCASSHTILMSRETNVGFFHTRSKMPRGLSAISGLTATTRYRSAIIAYRTQDSVSAE